MAEVAAALLALGQQVLQQQPSGEQPTVCFAMIPLLLPAAVVIVRGAGRRLRRPAAP